jgi:cytochrome c2
MAMNLRFCPAVMAALTMVAAGAHAQDAVKGETVYEACIVCHKLQAASTEHGPTLIGIIGRKSGTLDDFRYSRALMRANVVWDEATLDAYLADPQSYVAGMRMPFGGISDKAERTDLIAFLKTLR